MLFMRRDRETILKTFLGTLFVFGFVSSLHAQCSNLEKQTGDGTLFIVEVEADKVTGVRATEEAIKVLEARLKGIGAKGKVSKSIDKADRIEVKVFGTQDIEKLRGLFINHQLEIRAVVSPPNPNPYKSFRNFAEAINDIGEGQEVRPYTGRDGEDEHFVILEREAIVNGKDIRKAEAFSRTGFDDDNQIAFSLAPRGCRRS